MAGMPTPSARDRRTAAALALVAILVQIPFLERGISFYDEGSILAIADGLRSGETLYHDRVTTIAPLTFELMGALFGLFGPSFLVGRLLLALVFALCAVLVHQILREFVSTRWALCGTLSFLVLKWVAFPSWTEVNYAQLAMLFSLASVWLLLRFLPAHALAWLAAAGFCVGLTLVTKQNIGAFLGFTLALTLACDARFHGTRRPQLFLRHGAVLSAGMMLPLLATGLFYAAQGTLGDLTDRAVLAALQMGQGYAIPFPGLALWALEPHALGGVAYAYFPAPIVHMFWLEWLNPRSLPLMLPIELAVKATYYLPLLLLCLAGILAWKAHRSQPDRAETSRWLLLVTLAAMMYLSLYRADWVHLMSVFPPLLLVCVAALGRLSRATRWATRAALVLFVSWLTAGSLLAVATLGVYRTPIDTTRGRIIATSQQAEYANRVLAFTNAQEQDSEILFLRGSPLFYFLTERRIPGRFDLAVPRLIVGGDDESLADSLGSVDMVIYDPTVIPTLRDPITEYAPRTAATLATRFEITEIIHPTAAVLEPVAARAEGDIPVADLWEHFDELHHVLRVHNRRPAGPPDSRRGVEQTDWMMYRVIAALSYRSAVWTCFGLTHRVGKDEAITLIPMVDPREWVAEPDQTPISLTFEIRLNAEPGRSRLLYSEAHPVTNPAGPTRVPLGAAEGKVAELEFCTRVTAAPPLKGRGVWAGWAQLRIVRQN